MNGNTHTGFDRRDFLAFQNPLAHPNNRFGRVSGVLLERQHQPFRNSGSTNRSGR